MNLLSTHADNNALLVDFPSNSTSDTANEEADDHQHPSTTTPSSVSFSNTSEMMIFPRPRVDSSKIWFKSKDMNERFVYSVLCTRAVATDPDRFVTHDDLIGCIGIEHLLTPEAARRRASHRREHVTAVVSRQASCSIEELRTKSRHSSRQARYHAHNLAVANSKIGY